MKNKNKSTKKWAKIPKSIYLPENIVKFLTARIIENPPIFNMNEKIAKFYLHVLFKKVTSDWENETFDTYYSLCSKILDDYSSNYNKYFDYFVENRILEKLNHKKFPGQKSKCIRYRFSEHIRQAMDLDVNYEIVMIDMTDVRTRNTKVVSHEISNIVKHSAKHLSKWLNENLTIDYLDAKNLVKNDMSLSKYQKISYLAAIENLNSNNIYASRNRDTDNRIHTNLSNCPKILRPFIRYKGENLVNYDIKSSQPYFMIALVECMQQKLGKGFFIEDKGSNRSKNRNINLERFINKKIGDKPLMWQKLSAVLYSSGFQRDYEVLENWILEGVFYDEMMKILYPNKPYNGRWERKVSKLLGIDTDGKEIQKMISKFYCLDDKEDEKMMIKESVFSILYGGAKNPVREFKDFQNYFPFFSEFLLIIKGSNKSDFPILLQQIESTCVLDYVTKQLAAKYPDMPLFTVHDSIVTTESYSEKYDLKFLIIDLIEEFTSLPPMVEEEFFNYNYQEKN